MNEPNEQPKPSAGVEKIAEKCVGELVRKFGGLHEWGNTQKMMVKAPITKALIEATAKLETEKNELKETIYDLQGKLEASKCTSKLLDVECKDLLKKIRQELTLYKQAYHE